MDSYPSTVSSTPSLSLSTFVSHWSPIKSLSESVWENRIERIMYLHFGKSSWRQTANNWSVTYLTWIANQWAIVAWISYSVWIAIFLFCVVDHWAVVLLIVESWKSKLIIKKRYLSCVEGSIKWELEVFYFLGLDSMDWDWHLLSKKTAENGNGIRIWAKQPLRL